MMNQSQPSYPDLSKVTMLVTGANGGIGIDIVESALGAGAHVLATDLVIEEKLEAMKMDSDLVCRNYDLSDDMQRDECLG